MSARTDHQIINKNGRPEWVVVPYADYVEAFGPCEDPDDGSPGIPLEVARRIDQEDVHPFKAWREHLGLTQAEAAKRLGVNRSTYASQEALVDRKPRMATIKRFCKALDIPLESLLVEYED